MAWINGSVVAIRETLSDILPPGTTAQVSIDESPKCLELLADGQACHARRGQIWCRSEVLARMLHTLSVMSSTVSTEIRLKKEAGGYRNNLLRVFDAQQVSEHLLGYAADDDSLKEVARILVSRGDEQDRQNGIVYGFYAQQYPVMIWCNETARPEGACFKTGPRADYGEDGFRLAYELYRDASRALLGFILGHEVFHALGSCPFPVEGLGEVQSKLDAVRDLQAAGTNGCRTSIAPNELAADACGFLTASRLTQTPRLPFEVMGAGGFSLTGEDMRGLSTRLAIDLTAWVFTVGIGRSSLASVLHLPSSEGSVVNVSPALAPGYLRPEPRVLLLAEALRGTRPAHSPWSSVCDGAAELIAESVDFDTACAEVDPVEVKRLYAEQFDAVLAPALADAWRVGSGASSVGCGEAAAASETIVIKPPRR